MAVVLCFYSLFVLLFARVAKGQDCYAGSSYENINDATEVSPIEKGYWYLNLEEPCTCSGELQKYEAYYYELDEADYRVEVAVWKPRENEDGVFELVDSSKKQIRKDTDKKRRKRASTDGSESKGISNVFVRNGTVVGIYYETDETPMPIIGSKSGYSVCKYQDTSFSATTVNCTSSMEQNRLIHIVAAINKVECDSSKIPSIINGDYSLVDGDTQYGARVRYYCNEGYQLVDNGGGEIIMCDTNEEWDGTEPSCDPVMCVAISSIPNGVVHVSGNSYEYQSSLSFTCKTGYELVGESSITCLSNATWSDSTPTCTIINCTSNVTSPINGYANITTVTYQSTITFGCDNGYELMGNQAIECQADKQWNGSIPSCSPVDCGDPGVPNNATRTGNIFTFQSVVTFTCNDGYYFEGSDSIMCQADKTWNSSNPECIAVVCNDPGVPLNGSSNNNMPTLPYASTVTFNCDYGFVLNGSDTISCVDQNKWNSSLPSCDPVNCGPPSGNFIVSTPQVYTYPSTVYFDCITGYESNISDSMTSAMCQGDGQWSTDPPTCTPVSCGNPGTPTNGAFVNLLSSFVYNSIIEYTCDKGYELIGGPAIQCNADKQWNSTLPTCNITKCNDPGSPVNGFKLVNDDSFTYQDVVGFACNTGYELSGSSSITCTSMGTWNDSLPTCNPVDCGNPPSVENGNFSGNLFTYGNIIHYQCYNGYEITGGVMSIICTENGTWNMSTAPVCSPVQCADDITPLNGNTSDSINTYGSVIWFSCNEGYSINGSMNTTCLASGQWSTPVPDCVPVDCGEPIVNDDKVQLNNSATSYGSVVSFTCIDGYEVNGSSSISCQANGNWTDMSSPTCTIVNCGEPNAPTNGVYTGTSYTNGSVVQYMCNTGYVLLGSSTSTCTQTKQWSNDPPHCARICPKLSLPLNLMIVSEKNMYIEGNVMTFRCSSGYDVSGSSVIQCTSNGWSSPYPNCIVATTAPTTIPTVPSTSVITVTGTNSVSTTMLPGATSEVEDDPFPVVSVAAAVGASVFVIAVLLILTVLILLLVRNRKQKSKYDIQGSPHSADGGFTLDNQISQIYGGPDVQSAQTLQPMVKGTIDHQQDVIIPVTGNHLTIPRTASAYEVPSTLRPENQNRNIPRRDSSFKEDLSVTGNHMTMPRTASAYEVPSTLRPEHQQQSIPRPASSYEVPVTLKRNQSATVKRDLSKVDETALTLDLPPPIDDNDILETSFIGSDEDDEETMNGVNQLYMDTDRAPVVTQPQPPSLEVYSDLNDAFETAVYSELNDATETKPNENDMESDSILYSVIDEVDDIPPPPPPTSQPKGTLTAKRKTVIFEPPAEETNGLYQQLKRQKVNGIRPECIFIGKTLGSGYFGNVYKAEMKKDPDDDDTIEVAVKTLNNENVTDERDKIKFLQEAAIMAQFENSNVLKLYGVVVTNKSCMIVTELMANGDLLNVLVKMRPDPGQLINEDMPYILLNYSRQICLGLSYLSEKGFVHRDIAARNILVDSTNTCKIADFGLSRDLEDDDYYMANEGAKIPVKWTAPEALHYRKYSTASDVWSFGCLLYEIWSLGAKPFQNFTNMQALQKVTDGYRLPPPPGCSKELYQFMIMCWHPDKDERPTFQELMLSMIMQDKIILAIPEEDLATHPLAGTIGATLEAGQKMYEKLQMTYT